MGLSSSQSVSMIDSLEQEDLFIPRRFPSDQNAGEDEKRIAFFDDVHYFTLIQDVVSDLSPLFLLVFSLPSRPHNPRRGKSKREVISHLCSPLQKIQITSQPQIRTIQCFTFSTSSCSDVKFSLHFSFSILDIESIT